MPQSPWSTWSMRNAGRVQPGCLWGGPSKWRVGGRHTSVPEGQDLTVLGARMTLPGLGSTLWVQSVQPFLLGTACRQCPPEALGFLRKNSLGAADRVRQYPPPPLPGPGPRKPSSGLAQSPPTSAQGAWWAPTKTGPAASQGGPWESPRAPGPDSRTQPRPGCRWGLCQTGGPSPHVSPSS